MAEESFMQGIKTIKEDTILALQAVRYDFNNLRNDIKLALNRELAEFAETARL